MLKRSKEFHTNLFWIILEKGLRLILGVLITTQIALFLGEKEFGALTYGLTIFTLCSVISKFGTESIIIKEISITANKEELQLKMMNIFILRLVLGILALITMIILGLFENEGSIRSTIFILGCAYLFESLSIGTYSLQANLKYRQIAKYQIIAIITTNIIRLYFLLQKKGDLSFYALTYVIEIILIHFLAFRRLFLDRLIIFKKSISQNYIREILSRSFPFVISSVAILLYSKSDTIFIRFFIGIEKLGEYAAASRLVEPLYIIPVSVSTVMLPLLLKYNEKRIKLIGIYSLTLYFSLALAIVLFVASDMISEILYNGEYPLTSLFLKIFAINYPIIALGTVSSTWYLLFHKEKYVFKRTLTALIINIILNFFLVPILGVYGTFISTFFAYSIGIIGSMGLNIETKENLYLIVKAINPKYMRQWLQ